MKDVKKVTMLANLLAIAIILNIIERYIVVIPVPGAKIGISNIVVLIVLCLYGFKEAFVITVLKSVLVGLLYSSFSIPFIMGLSGGMLSACTMLFVKKAKMHVITISVVGAVFHTLGQVIAGIFVLDTPLLIYYLPLMLTISVPAGVLTGILAQRFLKIFDRNQVIKPKVGD